METARDIVNDSFLFLWENKENVEILNLEAYIYKVIRNKCLQYRRDSRLHKAVHDKIQKKEQGLMERFSRSIESCDPEDMFRKEMIALCRQQLGEMPELTQVIYRMNKFEGMTYRQIAEKLDIPVKKVDRELQYAAKKLRIALSDYMPSAVVGTFIALFENGAPFV